MRYLWIAVLVFALLWTCWQYGERFLEVPASREGGAQRPPAMDFSDIAQAIAPSVVAIKAAVDERSAEWQHGRIGSGLIIDPDGFILTSGHLVAGASELEVTLWDGRRFVARYYRVDEEVDIALVRIEASALPAAELGSSSGLRVGQWAIACGNPFSPLVTSSMPAISVGIISGLDRDLVMGSGTVYRNLIQTDAAINLGNSGGPLLDLSGRVVGIAVSMMSSSGANEGMGFAIPIDDIIPRMEKLRRRAPRLRI